MHKSFLLLRNQKPATKKNIVFLDIDGVIQPYSHDFRFDHKLDELPKHLAEKFKDEIYLNCNIYDLGAAYFDWDELALGRIKQILRNFNAYLVIHSAWRESVHMHHLKALFKLYDMDDYILDILEPGKKQDVIKRFLKDYDGEINNYIVVDDDTMLSDFGMNFCHTYDVFGMTDHLYTNRVFLQNYYFKNGLTLCDFKGERTTVKERKTIVDDKNISLFEIENIDDLNEYEVLMIYHEMHKYCAQNSVWCMIFKRNEKKSQYSLINKTSDILLGENTYRFVSPTDNYSDFKKMNQNIDTIIKKLGLDKENGIG